jgi:hypothetical protein
VLNTATNDFATVLIPSATNVTLVDANAIDLGACAVGGALNVTVLGTITNSGNLLITGITSLSSTGGSGGIAVDSAGNNFVGVVTLSSAGLSNISFHDTNNATLAALAAGNDLTLSAGGTISMQGALTVARDLTIAAGTLNLNSQTLDVIRSLTGGGTLAAAGTEAITVGGGFDPTGFTAANSKVTLTTGVSGNIGGLIFYDLEINKLGLPAVSTLTSTGGLAVLGTLSLSEGTWDAANYTHDIHSNWNATDPDFVFTASSSTVQLSTDASLTINHRAGNVFWNLIVRTLVTLNSAIIVLNDLIILDDDLPARTGILDVSASNHQITVGHDWTRDPLSFFRSRGGTVVFSNNGSIQSAETFYNLRKTSAGTTTAFNQNLTIVASLDIQSGTLAEGGGGSVRVITMGDQPATAEHDASPATVLWNNAVGAAGFSAGNGEVVFANAISRIQGDNTFWRFICDTTLLSHGVVLRFQAQDEQTIASSFYINGTATKRIQLRSTSLRSTLVDFISPPPDDPDLTAGPPGDWQEQWWLQVQNLATVEFADVQLSYANIYTVTPAPTCTNLGYNTNWSFVIPILANWTIDADSDGRIDAIRVQVEVGTQLSDIFNPADLEVVVEGYTVTGFGTAGGANDDVFDILLQEGPYLDTDARPRWQLLRNDQPVRLPPPPPTGLYGQVGGALVESGTTFYIPDDGARPVIAYTLAVMNQNQAYVHFSEPVYTDPFAPQGQIVTADFNYSGANPFTLTVLELTGNGAHAAMLQFTNPLTEANLVPATAETLNALASAVWDPPYSVDPSTYPRTNLDGNLPAPANAYMRNTLLHPITDVGLGMIEPVFALTTGPTTDIDPVRGGAGRITRFDGSAWLQDRTTQLQTNVRIAAAADQPVLRFDVNPGIGLAPGDPPFLQRLWIPSTATTLFANAGDDRLNKGNAATRQATLLGDTGALRDYEIDAGDSEIRDGANLELLFLLNDGGGNLFPLARVDDPLDPRTARPWSWKVRDLKAQRGEVTILNNVINPLRGEKTGLYYTLSNAGYVTVTVFDLKGDIVNVLYRGQRATGEYSTTWDGRNRGGRVVARGLYFIKVVGPDVNEIRKVLVVK